MFEFGFEFIHSTSKWMFISKRAQDQTKKEPTLSKTFSQSDCFISRNDVNSVVKTLN